MGLTTFCQRRLLKVWSFAPVVCPSPICVLSPSATPFLSRCGILIPLTSPVAAIFIDTEFGMQQPPPAGPRPPFRPGMLQVRLSVSQRTLHSLCPVSGTQPPPVQAIFLSPSLSLHAERASRPCCTILPHTFTLHSGCPHCPTIPRMLPCMARAGGTRYSHPMHPSSSFHANIIHLCR